MNRCVRCLMRGTVVVFETSGGSYTGPDGGPPGSGPLTGRMYACRPHAEEIAREDDERQRAADRKASP